MQKSCQKIKIERNKVLISDNARKKIQNTKNTSQFAFSYPTKTIEEMSRIRRIKNFKT